jgi:Fe-S cluster biogenesis protein NfuA
MDDVLNIRTERTPNPNSLKYIVGRLLLPGGSANFPTAASAQARSPMARRIFLVPGVAGVFIGSDFFTLTRTEGTLWPTINEALVPLLEDFFASGDPVLSTRDTAQAPMLGDVAVDPTLASRIQELLDEKIRPAVAQDGGDLVYRGYENGVVYLELHGACSSCPSSSATLKAGVESMLRLHLPEHVREVQAV